MVESGLFTLGKILLTLIAGISIIPLVFVFAPGDRTEPVDTFDEA